MRRIAAPLAGLLGPALLATVAAAAPAPAAVRPPAAVPLSTGWTLQMDGAPTATPTTVPGVFDARPLTSLFGGERGTYRVTFTGPRAPRGFTWGLQFEQVRRTAKITLNGVVIGTHRDPYVPFTIAATSLRPRAQNVLEVEVDNHKGAEPREGWWNWGGIPRPVSLVPLGPVGLRAPALLPTLRCDGAGRCSHAAVTLDGSLINRSTTTQRPSVTVTLRAPDGGAQTTRTITAPPLGPGAVHRLHATIGVNGTPDLWAPGHPALYGATITTRAGDATAQVDRQRIGLRSVAISRGALLLNGRRVDLRGASVLEDTEGHGPALTNADMDRMVADLRTLHATVTRSHYLLNPKLLDKLDAAGILVWTQAPIYHRDVLLRTPAQRQLALDTLRDTVLAARVHPSTLTYSVANELSAIPDTVPGTRAYLTDAAAEVRDLDPTLPVAVDTLSYPSTPKQATYAPFDLLGLNSYFGWYTGKPGRSVANIDGLAPFLRRTRAQYPSKALALTEFGAEATENGPADRKQTYAFQSRYIQRTLGIVDRVGFMSGAIYWTLQEFAVKPHWDGGALRKDIETDAIHNKGLIAYDGRPKPALAVTQRLFAATPLYPVVNPGVKAVRELRKRDPAGVPLYSGALLALLALLGFDAWCLIGIRADRREEEQLGEVIALHEARERRATA